MKNTIMFVALGILIGCGGIVYVPIDTEDPGTEVVPDNSGGFEIIPGRLPPFHVSPQPGDPTPADQDGDGVVPDDGDLTPGDGDSEETDGDVTTPGDVDEPSDNDPFECEGKIVICHKEGNENEGHRDGHNNGHHGNNGRHHEYKCHNEQPHNNWHTIEINCHALNAHLEHGDFVGECP